MNAGKTAHLSSLLFRIDPPLYILQQIQYPLSFKTIEYISHYYTKGLDGSTFSSLQKCRAYGISRTNHFGTQNGLHRNPIRIPMHLYMIQTLGEGSHRTSGVQRTTHRIMCITAILLTDTSLIYTSAIRTPPDVRLLLLHVSLWEFSPKFLFRISSGKTERPTLIFPHANIVRPCSLSTAEKTCRTLIFFSGKTAIFQKAMRPVIDWFLAGAIGLDLSDQPAEMRWGFFFSFFFPSFFPPFYAAYIRFIRRNNFLCSTMSEKGNKSTLRLIDFSRQLPAWSSSVSNPLKILRLFMEFRVTSILSHI